MNPDNLPDALYTAAGVRELDRVAIDEVGIPGLTLMRRAARACLDVITSRWARVKSVTVFCGSGNNAGDGYIVAGLLAERGCEVQVVTVGDPAKLGSDASQALDYCRATPAKMEIFDEDSAAATDMTGELIVDALLGTGLAGEVRSRYRQAIGLINGAGRPVVSVDIPSGLSADTGVELGVSVKADVTVTFIGIKRGLLTGTGPEQAGEIVFAGLDVPGAVYERVPADTVKLSWHRNVATLPRRPRNAHKRQFGHVLIVGGNAGMGGAVAMAGEAALRTGAGLVSIATHPLHADAMIARRPELMTRGVESPADLEPSLERATVLVLGPGLGTDAWSRAMYDCVIEDDRPMVLDADGLNLLAGHRHHKSGWVLTPHPGEAARLLEGAGGVAGDRFADVRALQDRYGGVALLKGAGTLISAAGKVWLCPYGNPGMSSAGMGDVLSGVIGALLAQGLDQADSAALGAVVHAMAADRLVARSGEHGLLATDLIPAIRRLLNEAR